MDEVYVIRRDDPLDHEGYPQVVAVFDEYHLAVTAVRKWQEQHDAALRKEIANEDRFNSMRNTYYMEPTPILQSVPETDPTF